jgi:hypothetical protein
MQAMKTPGDDMTVKYPHGLAGARVAFVLATLATSVAFAAERTVPGERWQQNITVKMAGMSMPMGNSEICAPAGRADEQLMKPEKNCKASQYSSTT